MKTSYTLADLLFLRSIHVAIDANMFASAFEHENKHRNFGQCHGCGAVSGEQHLLDCRHASVLTLSNWFEDLRSWSSGGWIYEDRIS